MTIVGFIDAAPDPVRSGFALGVVLVVIVLVILLAGAAALVFFLWYRKRSKRAHEMIRRDDSATVNSIQLNPNQPQAAITSVPK